MTKEDGNKMFDMMGVTNPTISETTAKMLKLYAGMRGFWNAMLNAYYEVFNETDEKTNSLCGVYSTFEGEVWEMITDVMRATINDAGREVEI